MQLTRWASTSRRLKRLYLTGALAGIGAGIAVGIARSSRRISFAGRTVLITGGSRGLGLVLAREFARRGARVSLLAWNAEELRRAEADLIAGGAKVLTIPCDVREEQHVKAAIQKVVERFGRIDVLVNNAGAIQVGPFEHMSVDDFKEALAIHLFAPLFVTTSVLPYMRRQGGGRIVNISSVGGKIAVPHLLPYSVSKFALVGLSDGLRSELRKHNIYVTTVCPGLMRTGSPPNASFKGRHRKEYAWFAVSDSLPVISMDARRAARRIVEACAYGSPRLILGLHTKAAVLLSEMFPAAAAEFLAIVNNFLPKPGEAGNLKSHSGWESQSRWAPSKLTHLTEKAASENNQRPAGS